MLFRSFFLTFRLVFKSLSANVGRTLLTLVGIVIGIASVIIISASGQGLKSFVLAQVQSFGPDYIQVETKVPSPKRLSGHIQSMTIQITTLKIEDAEASTKIPNVADFYGGSIGQALINYRNVNKKVILIGASAHAPNVDPGLKLAEGNFYLDSDDKSLAQVAVIGPEIKDVLFGQGQAVGQEIKIKGQSYRVAGVLEKRGSVSFFNFDSVIYIPIRTLQKKIMGTDHISFFTVRVKDMNYLENTLADVTDLMRRRHDISDPDKDDFIVSSAKEAQDIIANVFNSLNILLLALTSISLIVGGVGIMNVMYVTVVERTYEIGLRKAVGATSFNILAQFLLEAVIISLLGGLGGIILGFLLSQLSSLIFASLGYDLTFTITYQSILLAVGFSSITGIVFGFYPSYKASKLSPIEAIGRK